MIGGGVEKLDTYDRSDILDRLLDGGSQVKPAGRMGEGDVRCCYESKCGDGENEGKEGENDDALFAQGALGSFGELVCWG